MKYAFFSILMMCSLLAAQQEETRDINSSRELSDKEIDKIFISFSKEKEKEKKELNARQQSVKTQFPGYDETNDLIPDRLSEYTSNPVFKHNPEEPMDIKDFTTNNKNSKKQKILLRKRFFQKKADNTRGVINGIGCDKKRCVVFTDSGVKRVGDMLNGDKITKITQFYIKTKNMKIMF